MGDTPTPTAVDLIGNTGLTFALLDDRWRWRERLVETFEFHSTGYVRVRSSYQVRVPTGLVADFCTARDDDLVRVLVPVTTRPKQPLVGFDLDVHDARAHLPLRRELADIQSAYLGHVLGKSAQGPHIDSMLPSGLLRAICAFTPGVYGDFGGLGSARRVAAYLSSGLPFDVRARDVRRWQATLEPAAQLLAEVLEERRDAGSASENPLIALPFMDPMPRAVEEVAEVVDRYARAITTAGKHLDARPFLDTVAEYGRRWEVLAEAVVPVGRPCIIKVHEDRPLGLRMGGHCRQRLWSGDAASYHAEARVLDPAVVFGATTEIRDPRGHVAEHGFWEGRRVTQDAVSLYTSDADRPLLVDVTLRLQAAWWVRLPAIATMTLAAVAILVSRHVHLEQERLGTLALLAIPISLIAALLIVREQTSLAARLQRTSRGVLLGELLVLWLVVIHRLLTG